MVISSDTFKGALPATVGLCLGAGAVFALGAPAVLRPPLENKISSLMIKAGLKDSKNRWPWNHRISR